MRVKYKMLPADIVRHVASFLPGTNAPVVEIIWKPKLGKDFYDALRNRDGYRRVLYGVRSGIKYTLFTCLMDSKYVTSITRNGESIGCDCYHGASWSSAKEASDWLVRVMYSGHQTGPRIRLHR